MAPKAYCYIRFSTPEQLKGTSYQRQEEQAKEFCTKNRLELVEMYKDLGRSAFTGENLKNDLGRFIREIEQGKVKPGDFLLVEDLDRLSRLEPLWALQIFTKIIGNGISIVTLKDQTCYNRGSANQLSQLIPTVFKFSVGNEESAKKRFRAQETWRIKRKNLQKKPLTGRCPSWLKLDKATDKFKKLEGRCKVIERIFQMSLNGVGKNSIAKILNQENIPVFGRGRGWHGSYIHKILTNRAVLGEFQAHKLDSNKRRVPVGEVTKNYFERVIADEIFYKVRNQRKRNARFVGRAGGFGVSNLFTGKIKCGYCGAPIHYKNKGKWKYLVCDNASRGRGCNYLSWSYDDFEVSFLSFIREVDFDRLQEEGDADRINSLKSQIAVKEGQLEQLEKPIVRIVEAIVGTDMPLSSLKKRLTKLEDQKQQLEQDIEILKPKLHAESEKVESFKIAADKLKALICNRKKPEFRLKLRREIDCKIETIQVYPGGFKWTRDYFDEVYTKRHLDLTVGEVEGDPLLPYSKLFKEGYLKCLNPEEEASLSHRIAKSSLEYLLTKPADKLNRYFIVLFQNGAVKCVVPDYSNSEEYKKLSVRGESQIEYDCYSLA